HARFPTSRRSLVELVIADSRRALVDLDAATEALGEGAQAPTKRTSMPRSGPPPSTPGTPTDASTSRSPSSTSPRARTAGPGRTPTATRGGSKGGVPTGPGGTGPRRAADRAPSPG